MSETTPTRTDAPPGTDPGRGPVEPAEDPRRRRLASYTVRNMVYSMLLVLLLVLAWWSMTYNPAESQRRPPEVAQTATFVAEQAEWPVWVPEPGEGWTPTVVWFDSRVEGVPTSSSGVKRTVIGNGVSMSAKASCRIASTAAKLPPFMSWMPGP